MNTIKYYTLIFVGVFFFVIICATAFFSHRAYVASVRIEEQYRQSLGNLEQEVSDLKLSLPPFRTGQEITRFKDIPEQKKPSPLGKNETHLSKSGRL